MVSLPDLHSGSVANSSPSRKEIQPGDRVGETERRARLERLREALGEDPVVMLNLLKFKEGGQASFARYAQGISNPLNKYAPGATSIFAGQCRELLIGGEDWDLVLLMQYPNVDSFAAMWASPEYAEISHHRTDALERAVLYALSPGLPCFRDVRRQTETLSTSSRHLRPE